MIRKIILENFLAHGETTIELGEGMTVLTGPNNSGKSSVVEALRCIATNPLPKHFIRHGAKKARVELEMDDGVRVAWIRKKNTAWYEVLRPDAQEPEVYAKFGRTPPQDVLDILRLNQVPLESGKSLDVHIGNQRNPIFLLDQPSSVAAQFFASSSEASHLLAMQGELKARVRSSKREKKFQQDKMHEIRSELDGLQGLPDVNLELEAAREIKNDSEKLGAEIPHMENLVQRREMLEAERGKLSARVHGFDGMKSAPQLYPVTDLENIAGRISWLHGSSLELQKRSGALSHMQTPPELYPVQSLEMTLERQEVLSLREKALSAKCKGLSSLCSPPEVEDTTTLSAMISKLADFRNFKERVTARSAVTASLEQAPELFDPAPLMQTLNNILSLKGAGSEMQQRLAQLAVDEKQLKERIEKRLAEIGSCPLCGGELEAEKMIGEHVHES